MATKPMQKEQDIIADGRHVLARTKEHLAALKKADAERKAKLLSDSFLKTYESNLSSAEKAIGGLAVRKESVKSATRTEEQLRAELFDALTEIRDEVKLAHTEDQAIGRSFGVGTKLKQGSTPDLLAAAGAVIVAYDDAALRRAASEAGVTPARIKALASLRDALAGADTVQNTRLSARKGTRIDKEKLLRELKNGTAHIRKVAKLVFRKQPEIVAQFATTITRRTPKKRKPTTPTPSP